MSDKHTTLETGFSALLDDRGFWLIDWLFVAVFMYDSRHATAAVLEEDIPQPIFPLAVRANLVT